MAAFIVVVVSMAILFAMTATTAGAVPPPIEREPIDPPPVGGPVFHAPANGFTWRVASRSGGTIINPDEPDVPPLINFHYCAPERPNVNCRGDVAANEYTYDPAYVHPQTLSTSYVGCPDGDEFDATPGSTAYRYKWDVLNAGSGAVVATSGTVANCRYQYTFPINPDTGTGTPSNVRLTITDPSSSTPSAPILGSPFSQPVTVRDYLIVSIGDSYGSGEGNPDVPQKFAEGPFGVPLPWVERGPRWEDARCHRSATAGPAQAALRLEATDPHSSVTFLSFACSGANILQHALNNVNPFDPYDPSFSGVVDSGVGVLEPYAGAEAPNVNDPTPNRKLDDQITQVEHAVGSRQIDALVMSGGGNDVGFANLGTLCVLTFDCTTRNVTNLSHTGQEPIGDRVNEDLAFLDGAYDQLATRLNTDAQANQLHVGNFYVSEYPDPTRSDGTDPCWNVLDDVIPLTTVAGAATLLGLITAGYPPLLSMDTGLLLAAITSGAIPPFGIWFGEVVWAGDHLLPSGGAAADHGLDHAIGQAVAQHAGDLVPWNLVGGITADFQGTGSLSNGVGHGYCAGQSWIRTATDATHLQGPYTPVISELLHTDTKGLLHPNALGHQDYASHIFDHLKTLLPAPPAPPITFASADTNSTSNTAANPAGATTVSSRHGAHGWLTGCTSSNTSLCPSSSDHAVTQIVAAVPSTTTVRGAGLTMNGAPVDCSTGMGLPNGVTCQQELLDNGKVYKWSLQLTNDGTYELAASVTAEDDTVGTTTHEVKVDLHDPSGPTASLPTNPAPANGWYRNAVTVTFDVSSLQGVGVEGISYQLDGGQPVMVHALGQLPAGSAPDLAQVTVTGDGTHTLVYRTVDVGGRTSAPVTTSVKIDGTAPAISCGTVDGAWHASDVSVSCSTTDALSGLADPSDATVTLSTSVAAGTETANAATGSHSVCDLAGNCATAGPVTGNKVDEKAPSISVTTPSATTYVLHQPVTAAFGCTDGGSGAASCTGSSPNGQAVDTTSNGTKTFSVHAVDNVGNSSDKSVTYQVGYAVHPLYDQSMSHKAGSVVPVKLQLWDAAGVNLSSAGITVNSIGLVKVDNSASSTVDNASAATADTNFRYDASLGGYIFNLKTTGLTTGTWALRFTTSGDGVTHTVQFDIR